MRIKEAVGNLSQQMFHDISARREMARTMRKFARGGLSVDEFEAIAEELKERDFLVGDARMFIWYFYSDYRTDRPIRHGLVRGEVRTIWAKWILFLMTSEEDYQGPSLAPSIRDGCVLLAISLFTPFWPLIAVPALIAYYIFVWTGLTQWFFGLFGPREDLPHYWPFPSEESYKRSVSLTNPFAQTYG